MNVGRTIGWLIGIVLVLVGVYMLYFATGIDQFVSIGVITAGVLIFLGLAVMGFASNMRREPEEPAGSHHETIIREERATDRGDRERAETREARPEEERRPAYESRRTQRAESEPRRRGRTHRRTTKG